MEVFDPIPCEDDSAAPEGRPGGGSRTCFVVEYFTGPFFIFPVYFIDPVISTNILCRTPQRRGSSPGSVREETNRKWRFSTLHSVRMIPPPPKDAPAAVRELVLLWSIYRTVFHFPVYFSDPVNSTNTLSGAPQPAGRQPRERL
jgi:hypothetical protein